MKRPVAWMGLGARGALRWEDKAWDFDAGYGDLKCGWIEVCFEEEVGQEALLWIL